MTGKVLTIVGGGASSISIIDSLLDDISNDFNYRDLTIFVLEMRPDIGRGLAYADDSNTNLLNTKASFISPFAKKTGHFYNWLVNNKELWEDNFPDVILTPDAFLPRPLFGHYLSCMFQVLSKRALKLGCRLIAINDEAVKLSFSPDGKAVVSTKNHLSFPSDHVVLSCGNGGSIEHNSLLDKKGFFKSPYPIKRTSRLICKDASVAVLGTRLSAIDAVLGLKAHGHRGKVVLHSRSGTLPSVRGAQGRYEPKFLTLENIKNHISKFGNIRLNNVIELILKELSAAGQTIDFDIRNIDSVCTQPSALEFLKKEIELSSSNRYWQAVLYATNSIIDIVWAAMPNEDKEIFWPYLSWWMVYRVSIPVENAQKLLDYIESDEILVVPGSLNTSYEDGKYLIDTVFNGEKKTYKYDAVIVATGTPRDIDNLDNNLVKSMINQGVASPNPFGGGNVCSSTGCLVDCDGRKERRVTVIGELTSGTFFFTSVLEINARHAKDRAGRVLEKIYSNTKFRQDRSFGLSA